MYSIVLTIHSWLRWVTLLFGAVATLQAFRARHGETRLPRATTWDWLFMLAVDLQALVGLLLYFGLSPFTRDALSNFPAAMRDPHLRFFVFTHIAAMVVAIAAVRAGRVLALGEPSSPARRTGRYACFGIAWLVMMAAVPWPGLVYGRPFFRW